MLTRALKRLIALSMSTGSVAVAMMTWADVSLAFTPESPDKITVAQHDWAGSEFTTQLLVRLLKEAGYNAEGVTIDSSSVYPALESGDITFQFESWVTSHPEVPNLLKDHKFTNVGDSGLVSMDRWWYPEYVKDKCPGLPSYKALNDCAKLFSTTETGDKGRLLAYPEDWEGHDEERVANLGLNFEVVHAGSEAALLAEVKSAVQRKAPILAWLYEPHWAPVVFKGEYVELPPYTDSCAASGKFDCEKPSGPILKMSWNGAKEKWPHAYAIFENLTLTRDEYTQALIDISLDGKSVDSEVDAWMEKNRDRWSPWVK